MEERRRGKIRLLCCDCTCLHHPAGQVRVVSTLEGDRYAEVANRVYETICISDPTLEDCPIGYVNDAFKVTMYDNNVMRYIPFI